MFFFASSINIKSDSETIFDWVKVHHCQFIGFIKSKIENQQIDRDFVFVRIISNLYQQFRYNIIAKINSVNQFY